MRFYNTTGPVNTVDHYCLNPLNRIDIREIVRLIRQKMYFSIYGPRQSGKSSFLLALADELNKKDDYKCLYINIETVQFVENNLNENIQCILNELASRARDMLNDSYPEELVNKLFGKTSPQFILNEVLTLWTKNNTKKIVLIIDEIDSLSDQALFFVLKQLRSGYDKRPEFFPCNIILCGITDLSNYYITTSKGTSISGYNVYNINAKSFRIGFFTKQDIKTLFEKYLNYQKSELQEEITQRLWELTKGQPWLCNALANEILFEMLPRKNRKGDITEKDVAEAAENIIQRKEIHLKHISENLQDARVKKIITAMLMGRDIPTDVQKEDIDYVFNLGLININDEIEIANDMYKEIIPRTLLSSLQFLIRNNIFDYLSDDGSLNMKALLTAFQGFYVKHSTALIKRLDYKEAGPILLLYAFLQRIVDGGGIIYRDLGFSKDSIKVRIMWPFEQKQQVIILQVSFDTDAFLMDGSNAIKKKYKEAKKDGADSIHLIVFNENTDIAPKDKVFLENHRVGDDEVLLWGV